MKNTAVLTALVVLALAACDKKPAEEPFVPDPVTPSSGGLPTGHPPINNGPANALAEASDVLQSQQGTVVSVINIPQFTYLEIKDDKGTRWIAASTIDAKKGDVIKFDQGSTMNNFNSKTLNRTFASITFVNRVSVVNAK
jgi:hypothetical protein